MVRDADLGDGAAGRPELDQELGREERAARIDRQPLERLTPEELAGAVDVADRQAEEDPVRKSVGPGVERPDEGIGPLDPEPDDDIGPVCRRQPIDQPATNGWRAARNPDKSAAP